MPDSTKEQWYAEGLHFSCMQCGNCCTGPPGYVWLDDQEITAIAAHLKMSEEEFLGGYAHRDMRRWTLNELATDHGYDCVFLRRDGDGKALCSIYSVRPRQCRTWPFWPENLKSQRAWKRAARHCSGMTEGMENKGKFFPINEIRILRDQTPDI